MQLSSDVVAVLWWSVCVSVREDRVCVCPVCLRSFRLGTGYLLLPMKIRSSFFVRTILYENIEPQIPKY